LVTIGLDDTAIGRSLARALNRVEWGCDRYDRQRTERSSGRHGGLVTTSGPGRPGGRVQSFSTEGRVAVSGSAGRDPRAGQAMTQLGASQQADGGPDELVGVTLAGSHVLRVIGEGGASRARHTRIASKRRRQDPPPRVLPPARRPRQVPARAEPRPRSEPAWSACDVRHRRRARSW
jgi:hypothetical protein